MSYPKRKDDHIVEPLFAALSHHDGGASEGMGRLVLVSGVGVVVIAVLAWVFWF